MGLREDPRTPQPPRSSATWDELAGDSPAEPMSTALLDRAVRTPYTLLWAPHPAAPELFHADAAPMNLQADELLRR